MDVDSQSLARFRISMERSRPAHIHVYSSLPILDSNPERIAVWQIVVDNFARCATFHVEGAYAAGADMDERPIQRLLESSAPALRSLSLRGLGWYFDSATSTRGCSDLARCSLNCLTIEPLSDLQSITTLIIDNSSDHTPHRYGRNTSEHWLGVLGQLPNLSTLHLIDAVYVPSFMPVHRCSDCCTLPLEGLQDFRLVGNALVNAHLLHALDIPQACNISINLKAYDSPRLINAIDPLVDSAEVCRTWVDHALHLSFQRIHLHCESVVPFSQLDIQIKRRGFRITLSNETSLCRFEFSYLNNLEHNGTMEFLLNRALIRLADGRTSPVSKLALTTRGSDSYTPAVFTNLHRLMSRLPSVVHLFLGGDSVRSLVFEVLRHSMHPYQQADAGGQGFSDSTPVLPSLVAVFINGSALTSRTTWGIFQTYLTWRLEQQCHIENLYILTGGNRELGDAVYAAVTELPDTLQICIGITHDLYSISMDELDGRSQWKAGTDR
ncbi:hypothetical protein DFP72DRAFT_1086137 [Ephemerocybe angulata]|uniref:Uncharacterized protein n=1 Tax=Ephemerocybe angulata TaxID=980116 RepID=A0A8H6LRD4_9AGAR|nr:hypothetical protein DFP72DRAFT_1086137 [Tulosesus angulatus]